MPATVLKGIHIFKHLEQPELNKILKVAAKASYKKGDMIFSKEEEGNNCYVVFSGKVKIFTSTDNRQKTLDYLTYGDLFGEMSLLDDKARSASAACTEDCELLVINKATFRKLLSDPAFTVQILHTLSERLRQADKEIESLLFQNMLGRLASALIKLSNKGKKTEIEISLQELADYIGTTREPLSRALSSIKRCGAIAYQSKTIKITDFQRLTKMAPYYI